MDIQDKYVNFSVKEFHDRYKRTKEYMSKYNMDALMITTERNYIYYTGHTATGTVPHWLWNMTYARPFAAVLPLEKEPFLVYSYVAEDLFSQPYARREGAYIISEAQSPSWIKQRKVYVNEPFTIDYFIDAFKEFGLTKGVIGCEFGIEQRLGLPLNDFIKLQKEFPKIKWVDASNIFWNMRVKKSPAEIERLKEANRITMTISDRLIETAHVGMTTHEAEALLYKWAKDEGADYLGLTLFYVTGPNGGYEYPPTGRYFQKGDLLYLDLGAQFQGYLADVNRLAHFGKPPDSLVKYNSILVEISKFLMSNILPGERIKDVWLKLQDVYKRHGLPMRPNREGHGIGMQSAEWPSLNAATELILEPNMTITSEPAFPTPEGYYLSIEHTMLVTEHGSESLTNLPFEMQIID